MSTIRLLCLLDRLPNLFIGLISNAGLLANAFRLRLVGLNGANGHTIRIFRLLAIADRAKTLLVGLAGDVCRVLRFVRVTTLRFLRFLEDCLRFYRNVQLGC